MKHALKEARNPFVQMGPAVTGPTVSVTSTMEVGGFAYKLMPSSYTYKEL
jgi:hypothetical protein